MEVLKMYREQLVNKLKAGETVYLVKEIKLKGSKINLLPLVGSTMGYKPCFILKPKIMCYRCKRSPATDTYSTLKVCDHC